MSRKKCGRPRNPVRAANHFAQPRQLPSIGGNTSEDRTEQSISGEDGVCMCLLSGEELQEEASKWVNSRLLCIGCKSHFTYLEDFVVKTWGHLVVPVLHQYDDNFFIARFESSDDCEKVLAGGPYTVENQPLIVKRWSPDLNSRRKI